MNKWLVLFLVCALSVSVHSPRLAYADMPTQRVEVQVSSPTDIPDVRVETKVPGQMQAKSTRTNWFTRIIRLAVQVATGTIFLSS